MFEAAVVFISPECETVFTAEERATLQQKGILFTHSLEEAEEHIFHKGRIVGVTLTPDDPDPHSEGFLFLCHEHLGTVNDLQVIVCENPSPRLQGMAHELGVRNFWGRTNLARRLQSWLSSHAESWKERPPVSLKFGAAAAQRNWKELQEALELIESEARSDFRLAHILGHYHMSQHDPKSAAEAFALAQSLNPLFIPATAQLANTKLSTGSPEEALWLLEQLELLNDRNPARKALMAAACADLGRWSDAETFLIAAQRISSDHPRVREMKTRILFYHGDVDEAIELLSRCGSINEYFLSKLNEEGIKLSRAEQTGQAILLYEAAWRLAPEPLRYKLTYNMALAHKRQRNREKALEFALRAKSEAPPSVQTKIAALIETLSKEENEIP